MHQYKKKDMMKKLELIIGLSSILSLILNLLLVSGGGVMTVLMLSIYSMLYFALSFIILNNIELKNAFKKESYKGISTARIIGSIATGIALSITIIGVLFKFQSYPGANLELINGLTGMIIVLIVGLIRYIKTKNKFYINVFKRLLIVGGFGLILILMPKGMLIDVKYRNHPEYAKALKNVTVNPFNKDFQDKLQEERQKMKDEK